MKSRTKTSLLILVFLNLMLFGTVVFALYKIKAQNKEVSNLLAQADSLDRIDSTAQSIRSTRNTAKDDLAALDTLTLSEDELVSFISGIENLGKSMKLKTKTASVAVNDADLHLSLETEGEWGANLNFVRALESLPYKISIDQSTLSLSDTSARNWKTEMSITLHLFGN